MSAPLIETRQQVRAPRAPLIEARDVTRVIAGDVPATLVAGVNFSVSPGEFVAITGPSGSGKSSLLYLLGLLDRPTSGEVLLEDVATSALPDDARADMRLAKLGFVFQFHFLLPEFSARENVILPMRARGLLDERAQFSRADELLGQLGLHDHAHKRPDQLSGGQRQRVAIARALANDPVAILADEPTGNLDTHSTEQVLGILRTLVDERKKAVVVVTHDMNLAARADRMVRIVDGKVE